MGAVVIILIIIVIILVVWANRKPRQPPQPLVTPPLRPQGRSAIGTGTPTPSTDRRLYRPRGSGRATQVVFREPLPPPAPTEGIRTIDQSQLAGLCDAFTGAPLDPTLELYRCTNCQVYYHFESYEVLRSENSSRCVACSSTSIIAITNDVARRTAGRNFTPEVVTLDSFRGQFGRVITFEGSVVDVRTSRRGSDYAVMFERKSWTQGLKLVFFRGTIRKVGGREYIFSLKGRTVTVRGLLINDTRFDPEIIVSQRSMILGVR